MTSIVVDTSSFISFLRGEDREVLPALLLSGYVTLSAVVKLELLACVRKTELENLEELLAGVRQVNDLPSVEFCGKLLKRVRGKGLLGGILDIMILADCERVGATLLTLDKKLIRIAKELKIRILE